MINDKLIHEETPIYSLSHNKVVIMEDSITIRKAISKVMEDGLEWEVISCENQDEVVKLAEQKESFYFIFDNWVGNNKQEGLDALERIRSIENSNNFFVAILTSHKSYKKSAYNLGCNLFVEKRDITNNIILIANEMNKFREEITQNILAKIHHNQKVISKLERIYKQSIERQENISLEEIIDSHKIESTILENKQVLNREAYEKCKMDFNWLAKYRGKYVAFIDGEFEFGFENRDDFLKNLVTLEKNSDKAIFFAKVKKAKRIIETPTSLWFNVK